MAWYSDLNLRALRPPYEDFTPPPDDLFEDCGESRGLVLVWQMPRELDPTEVGKLVNRPSIIPLLAVLPPSALNALGVLELLQQLRPRCVLPNSRSIFPEDVVELLRAEPEDLSADVLDFLALRRVLLDRDTRKFMAKMIDLSDTVCSISELCRQLYVSRRALGRRFSDRNLPPPSHWLQFFRALRVCLRLQSGRLSVAQVATMFGYPDAFTLSNQVARLIGVRPSDVRGCLGWEWLLEAWIGKETRAGYFARPVTDRRIASPPRPLRLLHGKRHDLHGALP